MDEPYYRFEKNARPDFNLEISGSPVSYTDDLNDWFHFHKVIGAGASGIVVTVTIKKEALATGIFPNHVTAGDIYALKIQSNKAYMFAETETRVSVLVGLAALPKLNLAVSLFWARIIPDKSAAVLRMFDAEEMISASYIYINLMHYYSEGTFTRLALEIKDNETKSYAALLQIVVAMAQLRTIIPDFKHNDLHPENLFLAHILIPGFTIIYSSPRFDFVLPLFLTKGYVIKLADFGLSSGHYKTVEGHVFPIGLLSPHDTYDLSFLLDLMHFPPNWRELPFLRIGEEMKPAYYEELLVGGAFGAFLCKKNDDAARREAYDYLWKQSGERGKKPEPLFSQPVSVSHFGPVVFAQEIKSQRI